MFAAIFIAVAVFSYYQRQKRREELAAFSRQHNLTFDPDRDDSIEDQFPNLRFLQQGDDDRYAYNRMSGEWNGRALLGFDYHYQTHSTDSKGNRESHDHNFSAVILTSAIPLQPLFIRPEGFFDKIKEFFGVEDINFESAEFSRAFYVTADNKKWALRCDSPRA